MMKAMRPARPLIHIPHDEDPFSKVMRPPADESPEDRSERHRRLQEAQRISQEIDASLAESKKAFEKRKKAVKVLLLGQAESGKSTTLKNFQLTFTPNHFYNERSAWRTVIQLNLIRSVKRLLEVLQDEWDAAPTIIYPSNVTSTALPRSPTAPRRPSTTGSLLTPEHRKIRMRLSPLLSMESELTRKLYDTQEVSPTSKDICVRPGSGWKGIIKRVTGEESQRDSGAAPVKKRGSGRPGSSEGRSKADPTMVLAACKNDIIALWEDKVVKSVLKKHGVRLEDMPGFFLNDVERIATCDYLPSDDDILRARLRTLGVEEHRFVMESGTDIGAEWYVFDVGGSRGMRNSWIPYFDDVQAIIFLAPLLFNQTLEEDPSINRVEDSLYLWKEICTNPLLAKVTLVLFLNKIDMLQAILDAGVQLKKFVPSFGDNPNDVEHVVKFFRDKFRSYHKRYSPKFRPFFCHETSVVDMGTTSAIIIGVREGILHHHFRTLSIL
ncbi:hypothetical protein JAAARDRAFT_210909 [Jaapia argillacea MUCL 33604]|uniref:G-alpha-domain-containing protein n=1 Tax=Jaapia argillacea MUCL 33604 TaxID=933084 RepID=A0A067PAG9_9AGAM|nr:hypothetical protein JAAARDRAFT_210909 [Jaapia argillacea MUCL 33604]